MKKKNILKSLVFILVVVLIFGVCSNYLKASNTFAEHAEMMLAGFYELDDNSIDMAVVGNSHVYRYWQPAIAWKEYGLATTSFSVSDMPAPTVKGSCIEVLKTQSPKVLVVDMTSFVTTDDEANNKVYFLLDNMKLSKNKYDIIRNFVKYSDLDGYKEIMPYYLGFFQFHSRWNELTTRDFKKMQESYLNSCYQNFFLHHAITGATFEPTEERRAISPKTEAALYDLLAWCDEQKDIEIVFYSAPCVMDQGRFAMLNYVGDIIEEAGYTYLDYNTQELFGACGFELDRDFQDSNHVNVRGSKKFTENLAQYLIDNYGLESHSGEDKYKWWDKKADDYYDIIDFYIADDYVSGTVEFESDEEEMEDEGDD